MPLCRIRPVPGLAVRRYLAGQLGGEVEQGGPERGNSVTVRFPLIA